MLRAGPVDDLVVVFLQDFEPSSLLSNRFWRPFEPLQRGMVSTDQELTPQEVLAERSDECYDSEELLSCNVVVFLVPVVQLAGVADRLFDAILHL